MYINKNRISSFGFILLLLGIAGSCKKLDTINLNNPDREAVLSTGEDLISALRGGYLNWWQGVHGNHPAVALSVTGLESLMTTASTTTSEEDRFITSTSRS